jgi:eukaryotic-like serine/threonine-protein kinase
MPLAAGTRLGQYEIVTPLGAGGMGEVYRAVDSRLKRQVAIKILPSALATSEGIARFEREAELLASLNHPNIAQIYGVVEDERNTEGRGPVGPGLVMELVEGPTLADRIKQGPLAVTEALAVAQQIATALEAAHEQGIVHRDLKPANIKVRDDGTVKVLDFGLAKLVAQGEPERRPDSAVSPTLSQTPTLISPAAMTNVGMILGTAAYMSPEQARGKPADKRADVWAFGAVLYEMLSGARAFAGDDMADVIAAVMKSTPEWNALPQDVPPAVISLIKGCLEKDRASRIRDLAVARFVLATDISATVPTASAPAIARSRWRDVLPWALTAIVLGVAIGWLIPRSASRDALVTQLQTGVQPAEQLVTSIASTRPSRTAMAISPDGRSLVFVGMRGGMRQLYTRSLDRAEAAPIEGTEGATGPFFSPDGAWIGFWTDTRTERTIKKVPVAGGPGVAIPNAAAGLGFGASWAEDGTIYFAARSGIFKVSSSGGMAEAITKPDSERHMQPHVLPNGKAFLFTSLTAGWDTANIVLHTLDTGQQRVVIQGGTDARYVNTGHILYMKLGTLMAVRFDIGSLQVTGPPVALIEGVMHAINAPNMVDETGAGQFAVSPAGTMAYILGGVGRFLESSFVWLDRKGVPEPLAAAPVRPYLFPRLSPAGDKIAVGIRSGIGRGTDLWVYDVVRGAPTRLTFDGAGNAVWSPDGKRLAVFVNTGPTTSGLYTVAADGSGSPEPVQMVDGPQTPASWTSSANDLAVLQQGSPARVWVVPMQGDAKPTLFLESRFSLTYPEFSPDGKLMAYVSSESGSPEVYVQAYPGPGEKIRVSTNGGAEPLWSPNGRELFYRGQTAERQQFFSAAVTSVSPFRIDTPRLLFENKTFEYDNTVPIRSWSVSPDGQRFLLLRFAPSTDKPVTSMHVVLNWTEELKRRAPAR